MLARLARLEVGRNGLGLDSQIGHLGYIDGEVRHRRAPFVPDQEGDARLRALVLVATADLHEAEA